VKQERAEKVAVLRRTRSKLKHGLSVKNKMELLTAQSGMDEATRGTIHVNKDWPNILKKALTTFENQQLQQVDEIVNAKFRPDERYYAWASYVPPSMSSVVIHASKQASVSLKEFEVMNRVKDIGVSFKKIKKRKNERKFDLKNSIFAPWNYDLKERYKKMF
jgi:hypothetical protein